MLLAEFNDAQKAAFLVLAHKLTMADGEDAADEEAALKRLNQEMGGGVKVPMDRVLGPINVTAFSDARSRVVAMLELLVLAYTDDFLHQEEQKLVGQVCVALGFNQDDLNELAQWAWRRLDLLEAGKPDPDGEKALAEDIRRVVAVTEARHAAQG